MAYDPSLEPHENYAALQSLVEQGAGYVAWPAEKLFEVKAAVSGWSIGHHLYHLALAHGSIPRLIERLHSGRLGDDTLAGIPERLQVIYEGKVPGGRTAPEQVRPPDNLDHGLLKRDWGRMTKAITRVEPLLDELEGIPRLFPHLFFGPLTALEWLRFMQNHKRHHLGIIAKIEAG
ncbi:MAG: DinB family protein [Bacteroidota bacterium]